MSICNRSTFVKMEDSSRKEEHGLPLNQAIFGSGFSVTSKDPRHGVIALK